MLSGTADHCVTKAWPPLSSIMKTMKFVTMSATVTIWKCVGRRDASVSGIRPPTADFLLGFDGPGQATHQCRDYTGSKRRRLIFNASHPTVPRNRNQTAMRVASLKGGIEIRGYIFGLRDVVYYKVSGLIPRHRYLLSFATRPFKG